MSILLTKYFDCSHETIFGLETPKALKNFTYILYEVQNSKTAVVVNEQTAKLHPPMEDAIGSGPQTLL